MAILQPDIILIFTIRTTGLGSFNASHPGRPALTEYRFSWVSGMQ